MGLLFVWGIVESCFLVHLFVAVYLVWQVTWEIFDLEWYFARNFKLLKDGVGGWGWVGYGFMLRTPFAQIVHAITKKSNGWIVLKLRTHSGSGSAPNWSILIKIDSFCHFHFFYSWPHFVPKQVFGGIGIASSTDTSFCPSVGSSHVKVLVHLQANHWAVWAQIWWMNSWLESSVMDSSCST